MNQSGFVGEFRREFPGLYETARVADFAASTAFGMVKLALVLFFAPFFIIGWCIFHFSEAKVYLAWAPYLIWTSPLRWLVIYLPIGLILIHYFKKFLAHCEERRQQRLNEQVERENDEYLIATAAGKQVTWDKNGKMIILD